MPARPRQARLVSGFCSSSRGFVPHCFQDAPRGLPLVVPLGRCDQLPGGLTPPSHRSCRAHKQTGRPPIGGRPVSHTGSSGFHYGMTLIRSLIMSKVSFGTTFLATNSPLTRYGRLATMRSAMSFDRPRARTISPAVALLRFTVDEAAPGAFIAGGATIGGDVGLLAAGGSVPVTDWERSLSSF